MRPQIEHKRQVDGGVEQKRQMDGGIEHKRQLDRDLEHKWQLDAGVGLRSAGPGSARARATGSPRARATGSARARAGSPEAASRSGSSAQPTRSWAQRGAPEAERPMTCGAGLSIACA